VTRARVPLLVAAALVLAASAGCGRGGEGLALAAQGAPVVRVLLGKSASSVTLRVAGTYDASGTTGSFRAAGRALATTVAAGSDGLVLGGRATGADEVRVRADGGFSVSGPFSGEPATRSYLGSLLLRRLGARVETVNEVDLETYVAGVVGNEMGLDAGPAAHRAQAVASRTYAYVAATSAGADAPWHLKDTESSQVYKGLHVPEGASFTLEDVRRRVGETRGVVLTWRSRPFPAYYSSTCGGHTTDAATARLDPAGASQPLSGVPCEYCRGSRYFEWTATVSEERVARGLASRGVSTPIRGLEVTRRGRGGFASEVAFSQGRTAARKVVPAHEFRSAAGLRSARIASIEPAPGGWSVTGGGWGHGVGMCQVGGMEMSRRGLSETDILRYYYPGAELTRLY
jgi:stage II sporulation protein D